MIIQFPNISHIDFYVDRKKYKVNIIRWKSNRIRIRFFRGLDPDRFVLGGQTRINFFLCRRSDSDMVYSRKTNPKPVFSRKPDTVFSQRWIRIKPIRTRPNPQPCSQKCINKLYYGAPSCLSPGEWHISGPIYPAEKIALRSQGNFVKILCESGYRLLAVCIRADRSSRSYYTRIHFLFKKNIYSCPNLGVPRIAMISITMWHC